MGTASGSTAEVFDYPDGGQSFDADRKGDGRDAAERVLSFAREATSWPTWA